MRKLGISWHYLVTAIAIFSLTSLFPATISAIEITRYVSATGTGDGLTPENPTSNLENVLQMGKKVDRVNVFVSPGIYDIVGIGIEDEPYKNIQLFGVRDFNNLKTPQDGMYPTINCQHASFLNSIVGYVDFGGSLGFQNSKFYFITARKHIHAYVSDHENLQVVRVNCQGFIFENYNGQPNISLIQCKAKGGVYGLHSKGANIKAYLCEFSDCEVGGAFVETGTAFFKECDFINNQGNGGAVIRTFDKEPNSFEGCYFEGNTTDEKDRGAAVTILAPTAYLFNCFFDENRGSGKMVDRMVSALRCSTGRFYIENCLFTNNAGAIMTDAYPTEERLTDVQILNTAFSNNGEDIISKNGFEVNRLNCATDHGSGIPELDREQGLIIANGTNPFGIYKDSETGCYKLAENSCLINAGRSGNSPRDYYGIQRSAMGGTDIGPFEYVGELVPDYTLPSVKIGDVIFRYVVSKYKDKEYCFLAQIPEGKTCISHLPWGSLYVGEKTNMPVRYGDTILTYQVVDGTKRLMFFKYDDGMWECMKTIPYKGNKPVIKKSVAKKNTLVITADGQNYNYEF